MREGHRMEDENEWPYLVWENTHDNYRSSAPSIPKPEMPKSDEDKIHEILDGIDLTYTQHMRLFGKLVEFLNSKDCTGLRAEGGYDEYVFTFTRENKYVKTTHEFLFYPILADQPRIFKDCYTTHSHDGLLNSPEFQSLIRSKGLQFIECRGGYVSDYRMADDEFVLKDEMEIGVYFKAGSKKRRYKLDLEKMELSEDYFEY